MEYAKYIPIGVTIVVSILLAALTIHYFSGLEATQKAIVSQTNANTSDIVNIVAALKNAGVVK